MRTSSKITLLLSVLLSVCAAMATPNAWLSTRYTQYNPYISSSFRSPVTNGFMDLMLLVDNVTFTDLDFSIIYDSALVEPISVGSILDVEDGLTVDAVTTEDLEDGMKKSTISLSGNVTIATTEYESDAVLKVQFLPISEGTMPVGLWETEFPKYPQSYTTCSLTMENNGVAVPFERKEWNDEVQLFTFTDKTDATLLFQFDYNFGDPLTNGFLQVTYEDGHTQDFTASSQAHQLVIANEFGGYFITPQPDAVSYMLMLPGYENVGPLGLNGSRSISHSQPIGFLVIKEIMDSPDGVIPASTQDIALTVELEGIGVDFANHQYRAAITGQESGILTQTLDIAQVDDDSIQIIVRGGLNADMYTLYMYKDEEILGKAWLDAALYYNVTFTVTDDSNQALAGATVIIPQFGMFEPSHLEEYTDENGQAVFVISGNSDWGNFYQYHVIQDGYNNADGEVIVYDQDVQVSVVMTDATGLTLADFAEFASWWANMECSWNNNCNGFDWNYDGTVDDSDLQIFAKRWLLQ